MNNISNPKDLATKTSDDLMNDLQSNSADTLLNSLKMHYNISNRTQELYIEYLSEMINNLKKLQKQDRESLDSLKKQVLSHVLKDQQK